MSTFSESWLDIAVLSKFEQNPVHGLFKKSHCQREMPRLETLNVCAGGRQHGELTDNMTDRPLSIHRCHVDARICFLFFSLIQSQGLKR